MDRNRGSRTRFWPACIVIAALTVVAVTVATASAATQGSQNLTISAANAAKLTISISPTSGVPFGSVDFDGASNASADGYPADSADDTGAWYVSKTAASIKVKSNAPWNGTVFAANADDGPGGTYSDSMTILSGVLHWHTVKPTTHDTAAGGTAFSPLVSSWTGVSPHAKGTSVTTQYYALRVNFNDTVGQFFAVVTYFASQI